MHQLVFHSLLCMFGNAKNTKNEMKIYFVVAIVTYKINSCLGPTLSLLFFTLFYNNIKKEKTVRNSSRKQLFIFLYQMHIYTKFDKAYCESGN